ncbi:MAG: DNA polymerase III subunit beta [Rickettsiaceae bacterium]|nr:DNA polymerase III subunit beta [Rickettsiaceae bacterium]
MTEFKNELKIIAETKTLSNMLSNIIGIVEKVNTKPILNNVKLEAGVDGLTLNATDLDISIKAELPVQLVTPGIVTVNAKLFSDIVKKISAKEISLETAPEREQLIIKAGNSEFTLSTISPQEFPNLEYFEYRNAAQISVKELCELIESTAFSMSNEETRYNLNGVYLHQNENGYLAVAATDCHRLAFACSKQECSSEEIIGVIIPRKATDELIKLLKNEKHESEKVLVEMNQRLIRFKLPKITLTSKIIEGNFPSYSSFIPQSNNYHLIIDAKILAEAIDRVSTISSDKLKAVKLNINALGVEVWSFGQFKDVAKELIEFREPWSYSGNDIVVGFNPKYLLEVLKLCYGSLCNISLLDCFSPVLIQKLDDQENYKFVIMPIKV